MKNKVLWTLLLAAAWFFIGPPFGKAIVLLILFLIWRRRLRSVLHGQARTIVPMAIFVCIVVALLIYAPR